MVASPINRRMCRPRGVQKTLKRGPSSSRDRACAKTDFINLNISGKSIAAHPRWKLDHRIISEKTGNDSWYYGLKDELDMHPDLDVREGNYHLRIPRQRWKGPVEEIMFSRGAYTDNGLDDKYEKLSQVGMVGTDIPVSYSGGKITFTSKPFTQSGVQLLKFTPFR